MELYERWRIVGPPASALRGQALNHPVLRWLKTVVVSDREKARRDRVRWGSGRRSRKRPAGETRLWACAVEASKVLDDIKIGGPGVCSEMSLAGARVPGQAVSGVEAA